VQQNSPTNGCSWLEKIWKKGYSPSILKSHMVISHSEYTKRENCTELLSKIVPTLFLILLEYWGIKVYFFQSYWDIQAYLP
jgi:hypothetical protein